MMCRDLGDIVEWCQGVLASGRYRHGRPRKPVNATFGTT